ncbi:MAG TPA: YceI family protein [Polyangia bacterium]|nr:YceI family protein [Polyangia bacterium]
MSTITTERSNLEESIQTILGGDHRRLEKSFESVVAASTYYDPEDLRELWQRFERELLAHLDAEEAHVLPLFGQSEPEAARELLDQHVRIREHLLTQAIDLDLHSLRPEQVRDFIGELRTHAAREELLLYPWAARQLGKVTGAHLRRALAAGKTPPLREHDWRIDGERSALSFWLRHVVVHEIKGTFTRWGGTITLDEVDPTRSRVRVWVDLASIDTADPARDAQVRSAEFFDVARFPRAVFASTEIRLPDAGNPVVRGRLRLHGAERDVDLEIFQRDEHLDREGNERAVYSVKGRLDRRDFGLRWNQDLDVGGVVVGDQVQIEAHVEVVRRRRARP